MNKKRRLERPRLQGGRATRQKMAHGTFCPDEGPKQSTIEKEEPRRRAPLTKEEMREQGPKSPRSITESQPRKSD